MSTKKIFDDMYLYLKQVNLNHHNSVIDAKNDLDKKNGMPYDNYKELTSRFWNLIYKEPYNQHKIEVIDQDLFKH
jgi:hypothetical protein